MGTNNAAVTGKVRVVLWAHSDKWHNMVNEPKYFVSHFPELVDFVNDTNQNWKENSTDDEGKFNFAFQVPKDASLLGKLYYHIQGKTTTGQMAYTGLRDYSNRSLNNNLLPPRPFLNRNVKNELVYTLNNNNDTPVPEINDAPEPVQHTVSNNSTRKIKGRLMDNQTGQGLKGTVKLGAVAEINKKHVSFFPNDNNHKLFFLSEDMDFDVNKIHENYPDAYQFIHNNGTTFRDIKTDDKGNFEVEAPIPQSEETATPIEYFVTGKDEEGVVGISNFVPASLIKDDNKDDMIVDVPVIKESPIVNPEVEKDNPEGKKIFVYSWWAFKDLADVHALNDDGQYPYDIGKASRPRNQEQETKDPQIMYNNQKPKGKMVQGYFLGNSGLATMRVEFTDFETLFNPEFLHDYPYIGLGVAILDRLYWDKPDNVKEMVNKESLRWKWKFSTITGGEIKEVEVIKPVKEKHVNESKLISELQELVNEEENTLWYSDKQFEVFEDLENYLLISDHIKKLLQLMAGDKNLQTEFFQLALCILTHQFYHNNKGKYKQTQHANTIWNDAVKDKRFKSFVEAYNLEKNIKTSINQAAKPLIILHTHLPVSTIAQFALHLVTDILKDNPVTSVEGAS